MDRTFALVFWITSYTLLSWSEAGVPLNLRCTSRPGFSTVSRSSPPFLSAEPHLSFLPQFILPGAPQPQDPCQDVDETPKQVETSSKTVVIIHKCKDEDVEITVTKKKKESNEDKTKDINQEEYNDENKLTDDVSNNYEVVEDSDDSDSIDDEKNTNATLATDEESSPTQNDDVNNDIEAEHTVTKTVTVTEEKVISHNAAAGSDVDDDATDES